MKHDVDIYCKKCEKCFRVNSKTTKDAPPLHPIPVPSKVWSLVGIDMIGPLQESAKGNKYIVAATDHFSKWTEAAGVPNKSAECVADFIFNTICRHGCMDALISDQGREFINQVIDKLLEKLQVHHRISSPYHPQTNGQRERDNRTLKSILCKLVNDECDNWDDLIPGALFAYHTSVHKSTRVTPFEVMYGRKAKLPLDIQQDAVDKNFDDMDCANADTVAEILEKTHKLHSQVGGNIKTAQATQKEMYDKKHNSHKPLIIGSKVYIKNSRRIHRMGAKLEPLWIGPYEVFEILDKGRARLKNLKTGQKLRNVYHAANLKVKFYPEF